VIPGQLRAKQFCRPMRIVESPVERASRAREFADHACACAQQALRAAVRANQDLRDLAERSRNVLGCPIYPF
jgi:hypothetical protein